MQLTQLSTMGWKFLGSISEDIPSKLAIVGANGTGKTCRLRAISFAIDGVIPGCEKIPVRMLEKFADQDSLAAKVKFSGDSASDNFHILRSLKTKGKSGTIEIDPDDAIIQERLGGFPFIFDLNKFFDLTASKRQAKLLDLAGGTLPELTTQHLRGKVQGFHLGEKILENTALLTHQSYVEHLQSLMEESKKLISKFNKDKRGAAARVNSLKKEIAALEAPSISIEDCRKEIGNLQRKLGALEEEERANKDRQKAVEREQQKIKQLTARILALKKEIETAEEVSKKRDELETIQSPSPAALKMLKSQITFLREQSQRLDGMFEEIQDRAKKTKGGRCPVCQQPCDDVTNVLEARLSELSLKKDTLREKIYNAEHESIFSDEQAWVTAQAEIASIKSLTAQAERDRAELSRTKEELTEAEKYLSTLPDPGAEFQAEAKQGYEAQEKELQDTLRTLEKVKQLELQAVQARADLDTATEDWRKAQELEKSLGELRAEVLEKLTAPLGAVVNKFLHGHKFFIDDATMGLVRSGVATPFEQLSTGEQTVMVPALLAGLLHFSQSPWRPVFLDNIECISGENRKQLVSTLSAMVDEGTIDQFLVAGCMDVWDDVDGVEIRKLGKE